MFSAVENHHSEKEGASWASPTIVNERVARGSVCFSHISSHWHGSGSSGQLLKTGGTSLASCLCRKNGPSLDGLTGEPCIQQGGNVHGPQSQSPLGDSHQHAHWAWVLGSHTHLFLTNSPERFSMPMPTWGLRNVKSLKLEGKVIHTWHVNLLIKNNNKNYPTSFSKT